MWPSRCLEKHRSLPCACGKYGRRRRRSLPGQIVYYIQQRTRVDHPPHSLSPRRSKARIERRPVYLLLSATPIQLHRINDS